MTDREKLLAEAVAVGLILGADFEKNISNVNLQKKIDEKKAENAANVKPPVDENNPDDADVNSEDGKQEQNNIEKKDGDSNDSSLENTEDEENHLQKKIDESQEENANNVEETSINIAITSICAGYKESATSYEDAANITGVSIELIKSHIVSGKMINGYKFKLVG